MNSVKVWEHEYGYTVIPPEFQDVKITQQGWPDKRYKQYRPFMEWVADIEADAERANEMLRETQRVLDHE